MLICCLLIFCKWVSLDQRAALYLQSLVVDEERIGPVADFSCLGQCFDTVVRLVGRASSS